MRNLKTITLGTLTAVALAAATAAFAYGGQGVCPGQPAATEGKATGHEGHGMQRMRGMHERMGRGMRHGGESKPETCGGMGQGGCRDQGEHKHE